MQYNIFVNLFVQYLINSILFYLIHQIKNFYPISIPFTQLTLKRLPSTFYQNSLTRSHQKQSQYLRRKKKKKTLQLLIVHRPISFISDHLSLFLLYFERVSPNFLYTYHRSIHTKHVRGEPILVGFLTDTISGWFRSTMDATVRCHTLFPPRHRFFPAPPLLLLSSPSDPLF